MDPGKARHGAVWQGEARHGMGGVQAKLDASFFYETNR